MLTPAQLATLRAAILAETDVEFVVYRDGANAQLMAVWLNGLRTPAEFVWNKDTDRRTLDEAANYATFDTVSAGKRDAWRIFLEGAPRDMGKPKNRKVVTDVWGPGAITDAVLSAATRRMTRAEKILGGSTTETEGGVSAIDLAWTGPLSPADVVDALQ